MAVRTAEISGAFDKWPATLTHGWSSQQVGGAILNCLICLEMFLLSLMHPYVWPPGEASQAVYVDRVWDIKNSRTLTREESRFKESDKDLIEVSEVCMRFLRVFDLSDIPGFMGSVRKLGRIQKRLSDEEDDRAGIELFGGGSPKMRNRLSSKMISV